MLVLACEEAHIPARNPLLGRWELINNGGPTIDFFGYTQLTNISFKTDAAYLDSFDSESRPIRYSIRPEGNNRGTITIPKGLPRSGLYIDDLLQEAKTYELSGDTLRLIGRVTIIMVRRELPSCSCKKNINANYQLVQVNHTDQSPVQLDETKVFRLNDGVMISRMNVSGSGKYVLVDLRYWTTFFEKPTDIKWQGYLNNKLITERTFRVSSSCCDGYMLLAGDLSITL